MNIPVTLNNMPLLECFASETRVRMIELLGERPMSVGELAEVLELSSAIVTKHVQKMESAGLLTSESVTGTRGRRKLCSLAVDSLVLNFRSRPSEEQRSAYAVSIPVGQYADHEVRPTCGLASDKRLIGMMDDPRYFADPQHVGARHLWFGSGYVEYRIPNYLVGTQSVREISVTLELGSEAPGYNANWPSDISFYLGGVHVGTWVCPGNFGGTRGLYTPEWWDEQSSQYGLLKTLSVREDGTFMDGLKLSDITAADLGIFVPGSTAKDRTNDTGNASASTGRDISLRIESRSDAVNPGGVSLFGRGFGNYDRDIEITVKFSDNSREIQS